MSASVTIQDVGRFALELVLAVAPNLRLGQRLLARLNPVVPRAVVIRRDRSIAAEPSSVEFDVFICNDSYAEWPEVGDDDAIEVCFCVGSRLAQDYAGRYAELVLKRVKSTLPMKMSILGGEPGRKCLVCGQESTGHVLKMSRPVAARSWLYFSVEVEVKPLAGRIDAAVAAICQTAKVKVAINGQVLTERHGRQGRGRVWEGLVLSALATLGASSLFALLQRQGVEHYLDGITQWPYAAASAVLFLGAWVTFALIIEAPALVRIQPLGPWHRISVDVYPGPQESSPGSAMVKDESGGSREESEADASSASAVQYRG